jgi:glutathione S-transferase
MRGHVGTNEQNRVGGGHQHTLEESDRVKKSSVQRYVLKEKKDKRTRLRNGNKKKN